MTAPLPACLGPEDRVNFRFLQWAHGDLELNLDEGVDFGAAYARGLDLERLMPVACMREIRSSLRLKYWVTCALFPLKSLSGQNEFSRSSDAMPWRRAAQNILNETGGRVGVALPKMTSLRVLGLLPENPGPALRAIFRTRHEPPSGDDPVIGFDAAGRPVGLLEMHLLSGSSVSAISGIVSHFGLGASELSRIALSAQARIKFVDSHSRSFRKQVTQRLAVKPGAEEESTLARVAEGFAFLAGLGAPLNQALWDRALASINAGRADRSPAIATLPQLVTAQQVGVLEVGGSGRRNIALRGLLEQDFQTEEVLHFACTTFDEDLVRLSLAKGADPTVKNRAGMTALEALEASGMGSRKRDFDAIASMLHAGIARQQANAVIAEMLSARQGAAARSSNESEDVVADAKKRSKTNSPFSMFR